MIATAPRRSSQPRRAKASKSCWEYGTSIEQLFIGNAKALFRPDVDSSFNKDKSAIKAALAGHEDTVYAITGGSEVLYRKSLTGQELLDKINDVKDTFSNVKVGTADSWNKYADGTADVLIQGGVTLL